MGAEFPYNIYEELASLPNDVKAEVIIHLTKSMVTDPVPDIRERPAVPGLSNDKPWYAGSRKPGQLTIEEDKETLNRLYGAWSDMPEQITDDVITGRSISTREINLDD